MKSDGQVETQRFCKGDLTPFYGPPLPRDYEPPGLWDDEPGYESFIQGKLQEGADDGFAPLWLPDSLFDFQRTLVDWSLRRGRSAIFADCGLGKTLMQLVWAENVVRHTNKPVLILTPLAVSHQTVREASKFGLECSRSEGGSVASGIVATNYERLSKFDSSEFGGVVCDESSILKSFDGVTRKAVTEFLRRVPYRLLCTATAAPNDYTELGTSSEALGHLGHIDMLTKFFKNDEMSLKAKRSIQQGKYETKWRFKGHAEQPFWRWVCSWARAIRKPSDIGGDDSRFVLPGLIQREHTVSQLRMREGQLFAQPAVGLHEQREERRHTIRERCEKVAELVSDGKPALVWCHLNDEGDMLADMIGDAVQVSGSDTEDQKESAFLSFISGEKRVLVTKPKIGAWGLNFQHCAHITFFPSHSFEQYYQGIRRCWRFGQTQDVTVDIVTSAGEVDVMGNLARKAAQSDVMFQNLVTQMNNELSVAASRDSGKKTEVPSWL